MNEEASFIKPSDAVAVLQDLDADGQRVQRAAQLVEDVLQEVSAGLVDASEVFLRQRTTSALQQVQVDIRHTYIHSPALSRQRINIAAACTRKTFLLLQLLVPERPFFINSIIIYYLRVCCALGAFVSSQVRGGRQLRRRHRCRPSLPLRQSSL